MKTEIKFPGPTDGNGCIFGLLSAPMKLTTVRRVLGTVLYAAALAPITDALINVISYPR